MKGDKPPLGIHGVNPPMAGIPKRVFASRLTLTGREAEWELIRQPICMA